MNPVLANRIEIWPIERLTPYDRNARTHSEAQIAQIAASIQEFGFNVPILVEPGSGILAGHGRLMGARKLGLPEVPVIVLEHLTEVQRRAYILADNKLALNAGWDMAMLTDELAQLAEQISVELLGFDAVEFEAMLKKLEPPEEFPEYDENVETQHQCPKCGFQWSGQS